MREMLSSLGCFVEIFSLVLGKLFALHHLQEQPAQTTRLLDGLARYEVGHHVGGCLRDSASVARESGLLDYAVLHA